jgi:hypothetical protein
MKFRTILYLLLFSIVVFASCKKSLKPSWDLNLETPLVFTSMGINNIIPDSLLVVNPDNSLRIVYESSLYDFQVDSLVKMPDTITSSYFPPVPGIVIQPGQTIFSLTETPSLSFNNAEISRLDIKAGTIIIDIKQTITEPVIITYKIPSAKRNGVPFEISESLPPSNGGTTQVTKVVDIAGYSIDLKGMNGGDVNTLVTVTSAVLSPSGHAYTLTSSDFFSIKAYFNNVSIDYAKGYFGNQQFNFGPDTNSFSVFSKIIGGTLNLEDVDFSLFIENGFGMDAQVIFKKLASINTRTNNTVALQSSIIGQPINISRAMETYIPSQPVVPSSYNFDLHNSNIKALIENLPDKILFALDIATNPLGNVSSGNDFIYYGNYLKALFRFEMPLSLIADDLTLGDTVNLNIEKIENNPVKSGIISVIADNGFPFSADLQIYMLDGNGAITDSLFQIKTINAAPVDASNKVTNKLRSVLSVSVDENKINRLFETKKLYIKARFNTDHSQYTKIYDSYKLDLKVTARFNYLIQ